MVEPVDEIVRMDYADFSDPEIIMDNYYANAYIRHRKLSSETTWDYWKTYQIMRELATEKENPK